MVVVRTVRVLGRTFPRIKVRNCKRVLRNRADVHRMEQVGRNGKDYGAIRDLRNSQNLFRSLIMPRNSEVIKKKTSGVEVD
jgi:hypothetical protein